MALCQNAMTPSGWYFTSEQAVIARRIVFMVLYPSHLWTAEVNP